MKTRNKVIANLKPSALLTVALEDLKQVEKDKRYQVNMGTWHTPGTHRIRKQKKCFVCLAGAVMAKSLHVKPTHFIGHPDKMGKRVATQLYALNRFRTGSVYFALEAMGIDARSVGVHLLGSVVADYKSNKKQFFKDMQKIVKFLESKNL